MSNLNESVRAGFLRPIVILLLLVCSVQAYMMLQLRNRTNIEGLSPALVQECLNYISGIVNANIVPAEALAPRLLDDRDEMARYVTEFPVDQYSIVPVAGRLVNARFYLDDIDDVIKNVIREGGVWEPGAIDMLIQHVRHGSTVLDVGAHIGAHTLYMSRLAGPTGRVYAFEPQRKIYRELVLNMMLNSATNVVPLRFAAGDTNIIIEMDVSEAGNEGSTSVGKGGDKAELRTIDSFGFNNVSLIKIDVEHLEDQVIAGARETILRDKPKLLVEIQGGYDPDTAPDEIKEKINHSISEIEALGYVLVKFGLYDYLALPADTATAWDLPRTVVRETATE
jgi:FkbM family methyltransferase